jgi:hypothetical protein
MKIKLSPAHSQRGSAVLILLALLGLMTALILVNSTTLKTLRGELRLVEQRQIERLAK